MNIFEIRPVKAQSVVTPWGLTLTRDRPIRVAADDRLVEYARKCPNRLQMREIDLGVEKRREASKTASKPAPLRRRAKTKSSTPTSSASGVPTPSTRPELITQLGKDNRAVLKSRAAEFGLLTASGATKAELKADILAAFDARAAASPPPSPRVPEDGT